MPSELHDVPIPMRDTVGVIVEVACLYVYSLLFGASILGTILVEWPQVPYLVVAAIAAGWLIWKSHFRILEFLLTWALVIMVEENLVELKHEQNLSGRHSPRKTVAGQ